MKINKFTQVVMSILLMNVLSLSYAIKEVGNGGDPCEEELQEVRLDISKWLHKNGHEKLLLKKLLTHNEYKKKMLEAIERSLISCVNDTLKVGDAEKTCTNHGNHIQCTRKEIKNLSAEEKYKLIHHELAGIAGIEINNESEESQYFISAQLSAFLESKVVKKLSIHKKDTFKFDSNKNIYEQLETLYWESPKPILIPKDDLVKSGRCFYKEYANTPVPAIFFFLLLDPNNRDYYRELGLKEPQDAFIYYKMSEASNYFDVIASSYIERARKELNNPGIMNFSEDSTSWTLKQGLKTVFMRSTTINGEMTYLSRVKLHKKHPVSAMDPVYCFFNKTPEITGLENF